MLDRKPRRMRRRHSSLQRRGCRRLRKPIATTEACYSSPVNTENKGICHDGTQTCTGTLGACTGEQGPMPHEDCFNNTDDDCNGLINDGCPTAIVLGTPKKSDRRRWRRRRPGFRALHPQTSSFRAPICISITPPVSNMPSGIAIYCAAANLVAGASSYSVTLAAATTPARYTDVLGTHTTTPFDDPLSTAESEASPQ